MGLSPIKWSLSTTLVTLFVTAPAFSTDYRTDRFGADASHNNIPSSPSKFRPQNKWDKALPISETDSARITDSKAQLKLKPKLSEKMFRGGDGSGGGDEFTLDFTQTAEKEIYPWLVENGKILNPSVSASAFLEALDPEKLQSLPHVYESCDGTDEGREVAACFNGSSRMIYISRSLYPLDRRGSPAKRGLIAHELFRKMGLEGNRYEITRQIPIVSSSLDNPVRVPPTTFLKQGQIYDLPANDQIGDFSPTRMQIVKVFGNNFFVVKFWGNERKSGVKSMSMVQVQYFPETNSWMAEPLSFHFNPQGGASCKYNVIYKFSFFGVKDGNSVINYMSVQKAWPVAIINGEDRPPVEARTCDDLEYREFNEPTLVEMAP